MALTRTPAAQVHDNVTRRYRVTLGIVASGRESLKIGQGESDLHQIVSAYDSEVRTILPGVAGAESQLTDSEKLPS